MIQETDGLTQTINQLLNKYTDIGEWERQELIKKFIFDAKDILFFFSVKTERDLKIKEAIRHLEKITYKITYADKTTLLNEITQNKDKFLQAKEAAKVLAKCRIERLDKRIKFNKKHEQDLIGNIEYLEETKIETVKDIIIEVKEFLEAVLQKLVVK